MKRMLLLAPALLLAACGGTDDAQVSDPGGGAEPSASPSSVPAAAGDVRTRNLVTVMDTGDGQPQVCLGAVAESYPPQCGGPEITNWDWADHPGIHERVGKVRWGEFALRGTWDGTAFTVAEAIPAALYDPAPEQPPSLPAPDTELTEAELQQIADDLGRTLPGAQGAYPDGAGHVLVDVTYDDESLQEWADQTYGSGVVIVTGQLVDA